MGPPADAPILRRHWDDAPRSEDQGQISFRCKKGPFAGVRLLDQACGSVWLPKILGCHDMELAPAIEEFVSAAPDLIIDIGCAEDYFAVGFACRAETARVLAADTNPIARKVVGKMADLNGVGERVEITDWTTSTILEGVLSVAKNPAAWCYIEGSEWALLDPEKVPSVREARIFVEDHQHSTGIPLADAAARFTTTHTLQTFKQLGRNPEECFTFEWMSDLSESDRQLAISELRPERRKWIFLTPNSN